MPEIILDISQLVVGKRYIVETGEPRGEFTVGAFVGWCFEIDTAPRLVTVLPEDWDKRYPACVFTEAIVRDHYMFTGWEDV
jgi:hypothetical protein